MPTLISLVSEHTIPNLLFLKEFCKDEDQIVFINTPDMQEKGKVANLIKAANFKNNDWKQLVVHDANDIKGIADTFEKYFAGKDDLLVNITCGTKPMFLVAYNFFCKPGNKVFYLPIGRNQVTQLYPKNETRELKCRINVREYLQAYGISYDSLPTSDYRDSKLLKQVLKEYKHNHFELDRVAGLRDNEHREFFTGGWFEQFVYYRLRDQFRLPEGFIESRVKVNNFPNPHRAGFDNELDVVFTLNNEIYVIEAKVSIGQKKLNKSNLDNILFKLSALNKNFGLRSHAWIVTLADLSRESIEFKQDLLRKMQLLGIEGIEDRSRIIQTGINLFNKEF